MSHPFRGTRKKQRSTKRRPTPEQRLELAKDCKHRRVRYRCRGTEAVCLNCGLIQQLKVGTFFNVEVTKGWDLSQEDAYAKPQPLDAEGTIWRYELGLERPGQPVEKLVVSVEKRRVANLQTLKDFVVMNVIEPPAEVGTKLKIYHLLFELQNSPITPKPTWVCVER